jgi:hypothetical protein
LSQNGKKLKKLGTAVPFARFFPDQIATVSRRFWKKKGETVPTVKPSAQVGTLTAAGVTASWVCRRW